MALPDPRPSTANEPEQVPAAEASAAAGRPDAVGEDPGAGGRTVEAVVTPAEAVPDEPGQDALLASPAADAGEDPSLRQLHPLPRGLVELYGLLAVLFVLVPEWMAGGALFGFREGRLGSELPTPSGAWKRVPELRLASLNLAELRLLARQAGLIGYSRQNRHELTVRLLRRLRGRP